MRGVPLHSTAEVIFTSASPLTSRRFRRRPALPCLLGNLLDPVASAAASTHAVDSTLMTKAQVKAAAVSNRMGSCPMFNLAMAKCNKLHKWAEKFGLEPARPSLLCNIPETKSATQSRKSLPYYQFVVGLLGFQFAAVC
jgi:hypothetical protein